MTTTRSPGSREGRVPGGGFGDQERRGQHPLSRFGDSLAGILAKLVFLAAVNGAALFMVVRMVTLGAPWWALALTAATTLALDALYIGKGHLPLKYLIPGTIFLLVFQVFPFVYTFYIAFTNYGLGQLLTKEQAVERIERSSIRGVPDAPRFAAVPFADGDDLALLLTRDEAAFFGTPHDGLVALDELDVEAVDGRVVAVDGYQRLSLGAAQDRLPAFTALRIPVEAGEIQLVSLTTATVREQARFYDPATDTIIDEATGTVYVAAPRGRFVSEDGTQTLSPGWRVLVGGENFVRAFTNEAIRGPFVRILVWTYAFAFLSTAGTFALGLVLAITLNHPGVRGRKFIRLAMIVPYALPTFMTALIWRGMMNRRFGVINELLGAEIPWLNDPTMAKVSVVLVNLWFGFPYMFLICSAALQSIPSDLYEAASVDGAGAWSRFRRLTLPLLLVATAPVLVATFAFNFNNFNVIYLLTGGNPPIAGAITPAGHTDILISYTYRIAFESGGGQDFGLGATVAVLTFALVAVIAVVSFKFMRPLEEVHE